MNEKESYNNGLSPSAAEVNPAMRAAHSDEGIYRSR